jgi:hypothetical protein
MASSAPCTSFAATAACPGSATAACPGSATAACPGSAPIKALLPAGAVGAGVATLAVVAQSSAARPAGWLLAVTPLRLPLVLVEIAGPGLIRSGALRRRLVLSEIAGPLLAGLGLIEISRPLRGRLRSSPVLAHAGLVRSALLPQVPRIFISELLRIVLIELRLIVFLIEVRLRRAAAKVVGAVTRVIGSPAVQVIRVDVVPVHVIGVDVIPIDVIGVDVIPIDVIRIDVVSIDIVGVDVIPIDVVVGVVIVPVNESIGI